MIALKEGKGGLPFVQIENQAARAAICLLGATVTEYRPLGTEPVLWTSPNSQFEPGASIRGGIPVCWPWFGANPTPGFPGHGFVRNQLWEVSRMEDEAPNRAVVELTCQDNETSHQFWPNPYHVRLKVVVGPDLSVTLSTTNPGERPFTYSGALHTYFQISDIETIQINGLENTPFLSKVHNFERFVEAEPVRIGGQVDRVYLETESKCILHDPGWKRRIVIEKEGSRTTVVWNPWAKISAEVADLGPEQYRKFVCVETVVGPQEHKQVQPGETHSITQHVRVETD